MINYSKHTDEDLLKLIQQDDCAAFTEVYNRYWRELYRSAYRHLKVEALAEEVVQEVFVSLHLNKEKVVIKESFRGYFYTLVKHKVLNEIRSAVVRNSYKETISPLEAIADETPFSQLTLLELQKFIQHTILHLPEKCQEAYRLSRNENLSHQSIAEKMGISVSTVEKHVGKALKSLRQDVNQYYTILVLLIASRF